MIYLLLYARIQENEFKTIVMGNKSEDFFILLHEGRTYDELFKMVDELRNYKNKVSLLSDGWKFDLGK